MRSLVNHIDELRVLLATSLIDVLAINETWLNPTISDNDVYIPGYDIIRRDRAFKSADGKTYGGVCFYVHSSVNFIQRKDMSIDDLENQCTQIQKPNSKPFSLRPGILMNLITLKLLLMIDAENVDCYLLGDLNCDIGSPISDHSLIYAFRKVSTGLHNKGHSTVNYRKFKNFNLGVTRQ